MAHLDLANISKLYGTKTVLDDVNVSVREGSFCALLGPSGSGKTTLLRVIAGFVAPDQGIVGVGGRDVSSMPANERNVGVVFQSYALFPHMNVFDNVSFGLRMRRVKRPAIGPRVREMLELVGLAEFEQRRPSELSGGQQQRVALARALVIDPDLLLLDEPLSALDRKIREEMRLEIKRIHRETGLTTILVTHDQEEALDLADHLLVLESGRVRQAGTPAEIYAQPADLFVADFMGYQRLPAGTYRTIEGRSFIDVGSIGLPARDLAIPSGTPVDPVVRPECVDVQPVDNDDPPTGSLTGRVRDVGAFGSFARVTVDVGFELVALILSPTAYTLTEDQLVSVGLNPAGVLCYPTAGSPKTRGSTREYAVFKPPDAREPTGVEPAHVSASPRNS